MASCNRDDIAQAGVYFLFCKEDDGSDSVYIGEAENDKERLVQHLRDYQSEKEKYYWTTAAIFIGRDLNKALIRYLENRFVELQGSHIAIENDDTIPAVLKKQRRKVSVVDGVLQEDVLFSSPSYVAMFVIGKSANGLTSWKDENGRSLKDIENSETN